MNINLKYALISAAVVLTLCLISFLLEAWNDRQEILRQARINELEIMNAYNKENDKTYETFYGQGSRQKVLGRQENMIVVNFRNQDQELASSLKNIG